MSRCAGKNTSQFSHISDVVAHGELGRADGLIMNKLMQHVCPATGLIVTEAPADRAHRIGEYMHLASRDASAPPGRLRVYLRDQDEVARLFDALHNQTIQAGNDTIRITITNNLKEHRDLQGKVSRSQA